MKKPQLDQAHRIVNQSYARNRQEQDDAERKEKGWCFSDVHSDDIDQVRSAKYAAELAMDLMRIKSQKIMIVGSGSEALKIVPAVQAFVYLKEAVELIRSCLSEQNAFTGRVIKMQPVKTDASSPRADRSKSSSQQSKPRHSRARA